MSGVRLMRRGSLAPAKMSGALPSALIDLNPASLTGSTGDAVSTVPDVSGNGRDFTQSASTDQPTLSVAAVNGANAVTFNGRYVSNTATGISGITSFTVCFVLAVNSASSIARGGILSGLNSASDNDYSISGPWDIGHPFATTETTFTSLTASGSLTSVNDVRVLTSSRPFGQFVILTVQAGADGNRVQVYVNGVAESPVTGRSGTLSCGRMYIGTRYYSAGAAADRARFTLARMRFYAGRLNSTQLSALNGEMSAAYGIATS